MPTFAVLFIIVAVVSAVRAGPVLVAVDLPDRESVHRWQGMEIPTFDVIEGVALAEMNEADVSRLREIGFSATLIDANAWSDPYFVGRESAAVRDLPGSVIWQGKHTALLKVPQSEARRVFTSRLRLREMPRREVSDRVWVALLKNRTVLFRQGRYPFIQSLVDQVDGDSLAAYTQRLEAFRTRLMLTDSSYASSQWIADMFSSWGYPAVFDSFFVDGSWVGDFPGTGFERSVIATELGTHMPADHVVMGGHFDSIVWPNYWDALEYAPGADDNATGVAAAMEAARIFRGHSWDRTIQFMAFGGEELGLFGSWDYAVESDEANRDIRGVVNLDMIGYLDDGLWELNVGYVPHGEWLAGLMVAVGQTFEPSIELFPLISYDGSDHAPFNAMGYSAIAGEERWIPNNPHWHVQTDTWEQITPEYFTAVARIGIATTAILALFPDEVDGVEIVDVGTGTDLEVHWSPSTEWDIVGYRVYWRTNGGTYNETQSASINGASVDSHVLTDLVTGETYYVIVMACDADGYESFVGVEVPGTPRAEPAPPGELVATPIKDGVALQWNANTEIDLAGYRVFRRPGSSTEFEALTTELVLSTTFIDSPLAFGDYYYVVRAFDHDGNAGSPSGEVFSRPMTLDQGILVVDETRNYATLPDSLQDDFYRHVFEGTLFSEFEFGIPAERPRLADLAPFSSVVWHAEDFAEFLASGSVEDLRRYLDAGGNFLLIGWKPMANLTNDQAYPKSFESGSFVHDYLRISHASLSGITDAIGGAHGLRDYPDLSVQADSIAVPSWNGTLRYVEAYTPTDGEPIYLVDAVDDQNPFEGLVCGVRYLGDDYRAILLGMPLYPMGRDQARAVVRRVLNDFDEPLHGGQNLPTDVTPREVHLISVTPNPCATRVTIRYALSSEGQVQVSLYDLGGREIIRLADSVQARGTHEIAWDVDTDRVETGSGVYVCRVTQGGSRATKRVVVMP